MFKCRMCSENPFTQMFGEQQNDKHGEKKKKPQKAGKSASSRKPAFNPRPEEEIAYLVEDWMQYAQPRFRETFPDDAALRDVLTQVAKGIDRNCDPITGDDKTCVFWHGNVTKDDHQAAIIISMPDETQPSVTYVNRVLAFVFAVDESYQELMKLPRDPFNMICGDQLCVHLAHIFVPESMPE